jgi:diguanylate cyclase (GGDEF)-like protein
MFIDLDDFKSVNDNYGHATGDLLLVQIASALKTAVGDKGKVARVSGDEFVGLFHCIDDQALEAISADVLTAISKC